MAGEQAAADAGAELLEKRNEGEHELIIQIVVIESDKRCFKKCRGPACEGHPATRTRTPSLD